MSYRMMAGLLVSALSLPAATPLSLKVSREAAPPGGVAQIKLSVTDPKPIIRGWADMDFGSYMDDVLGVAVQSPGGDVTGTARLVGGRLKIEFSSPLASFGTTLDYPAITIAIRVRKDVRPGTTYPININLNTTTWLDANGDPYAVECRAGELQVNGTMSVDNIFPGGGRVAAGTPVKILGQGFTAKTNVNINTDAKYTARLISANEIQVAFTSTVDLRGTRFMVKDRDTDLYYSYLRSAALPPVGLGPLVSAKPLFPGVAALAAYVSFAGTAAGQGIALENPTPGDAKVRLERYDAAGTRLGEYELTLPAYSRQSIDLQAAGLGVPGPSVTRVVSTAGVEIVGLSYDAGTDRVLPVTPAVVLPAL